MRYLPQTKNTLASFLVFRVFLLLFLCIPLTSCLVQKDDEGFKLSITNDARVIGNWDVQKYLVENLSCKNCSSIITFEEQQYNGKTVYKMLSDNPHLVKDVGEFITLYNFGGAFFLYTGYPEKCERCVLMQYKIVGNTLTVYVLKDQDAAKFLQKIHSERTKIFYEDNPKTLSSNVRIDILDIESKELLATMAQKKELWEAKIIMKKL